MKVTFSSIKIAIDVVDNYLALFLYRASFLFETLSRYCKVRDVYEGGGVAQWSELGI